MIAYQCGQNEHMRQNHEYKYRRIQVIHVETKLKVQFFQTIHGNSLSVCGGMILEIVQKHEVHNQYVWR